MKYIVIQSPTSQCRHSVKNS